MVLFIIAWTGCGPAGLFQGAWTPIRYVNRAYSRSVLAGLQCSSQLRLLRPAVPREHCARGARRRHQVGLRTDSRSDPLNHLRGISLRSKRVIWAVCYRAATTVTLKAENRNASPYWGA
jgi:hypothetical protein